jgi:hypothetical protein
MSAPPKPCIRRQLHQPGLLGTPRRFGRARKSGRPWWSRGGAGILACLASASAGIPARRADARRRAPKEKFLACKNGWRRADEYIRHSARRGRQECLPHRGPVWHGSYISPEKRARPLIMPLLFLGLTPQATRYRPCGAENGPADSATDPGANPRLPRF